VLIAEDDANVRLTLEFVLEDEGFEVLHAEDGEEALNLALSSQPHAILLDQLMPKMNGRQVFSALRRADATKAIPVFILSGMQRRSEDDWAGAQFVDKPFSPDELVRMIRAAIDSG
jgi:DNA-binding response OmpR family regulator